MINRTRKSTNVKRKDAQEVFDSTALASSLTSEAVRR